MATRVCVDCKLNKYDGDFHYANKVKDTKQKYCKICAVKRVRKYRKAQPRLYTELQRNSQLQKTYGITLADYNKMLGQQNNVCAICQKPETSLTKLGRTKQLSVDHCHDTGKIRGILCTKCNWVIGFINEDTEALRRAIEYLEKER